jgi:hypothetical protein
MEPSLRVLWVPLSCTAGLAIATAVLLESHEILAICGKLI